MQQMSLIFLRIVMPIVLYGYLSGSSYSRVIFIYFIVPALSCLLQKSRIQRVQADLDK